MRWFRRLLWAIHRPMVLPWFVNRARKGNPPAIPWGIWKRIHPDLWASLTHHLVRPAEDEARQVILNHHFFQQVITEEDLRNDVAASPMTLLLLWRKLQHLRPRCIVELGSGTTTRLFAQYALSQEQNKMEPPTILSFDHESHWTDQTKKRLEAICLQRFVNLRCRTLRKVGGQDICYDIADDDLPSASQIDLLFIDGPPGNIGRKATLDRLHPWLSHNATVLLDDTCRVGEQQAVSSWKMSFAQHIQKISSFPTIRGLTEIRWK